MKATVIVCLVLFSFVILPVALQAQSYELHPYVGGIWPDNDFWPGRNSNSTLGRLRNEGIYGAKAGVFVTPKFELGGNFGYINHLEPSAENPILATTAAAGIPSTSLHGMIFEGTADYNFTAHHFMGREVTPYISGGAGALMTQIPGSASTVTYLNGSPTSAPFVVNNHDYFFTFSYGGGVKALNLWGPVGLRADIRGRTIPNFIGNHATNWPEASGGLTFTWGER